MSDYRHKGQILPIQNQMIPISKDTTFHASYDHGLHGFNQGEIVYPIAPERALSFNSPSTYIECGKMTNLNLENGFTVSAWMKTTVGDQDHAGLFVGSIPTSNTYFFRLVVRSGNWDFGVNSNIIEAYTRAPIALGRWTHITGVADGAMIKIYINGILGGQVAHPGPYQNNDSNMIIGKGRGGFNGEISEVRIWNKPMTQEEVKENMYKNTTKDVPSLVGYWKLNEKEGPVAYDSSPNKNDGLWYGNIVSTNGPTIAILKKGQGKFGGTVSIEGDVNGELKYPVELLNHNEGTLSFWAKLPYALPYQPPTDETLWMSTSSGSASNNSLSMTNKNNSFTDRVISVQWGSTTGASNFTSLALSEAKAYNNGDWNMYTITWNKDTGYKVYINGRLELEGKTNLPLRRFNSDFIEFKGMMMDELRIESRAISEEEAQAWATSGLHYNYLDYSHYVD